MTFDREPKIREYYDKLPDGIRKAIAESGWEEELRSITRANRLHIDQGAMLETEVMLVLIGLDAAQNFEENIKRELGLTLAQSGAITEQVNEKIFQHIRKIFAGRLDEEGSEESLDAEKILKEIENPQSALPIGKPTAAKVAGAKILPPPPLPPAVPMPPAPPALYAAKLSSSQSIPPTDKSVPMPRGPILEQKKYSVDPYRELP